MRLAIRAQRQEQRVYALGLKEHYWHIFELTQLQEVFGAYETEDEALAKVLVVNSLRGADIAKKRPCQR